MRYTGEFTLYALVAFFGDTLDWGNPSPVPMTGGDMSVAYEQIKPNTLEWKSLVYKSVIVYIPIPSQRVKAEYFLEARRID